MTAPTLLAAAFALTQGSASPAMDTPRFSLASRFEIASPLPTIPGVMIDRLTTGAGLLQQVAHREGLQGRMLWIDATANVERYDSEEKIAALVARIRDSGFNTIVFDIKPISGQTVYPSALAPKLLEWRGKRLPADFDPVEPMVRLGKAVGLSVLVSLNAFSEGHRLFKVGPGYNRTDQQTVIYETDEFIQTPDGGKFGVASALNKTEPNLIGVYSAPDKLPARTEGAFAVTLRRTGEVVDGFEYGGIGTNVPTVPRGGAILYGTGDAAAFLRDRVVPQAKVSFTTTPVWVPMADWGKPQIPLMMNPNNPEVRQYALDIVREVVQKYDIDGVLYDDRLRYAGIDADFSEITRTKFEKVIGKKLTWPDDVFSFTLNQNLTRGVRPGRYYDQWMAWRADVLREYVADVRKLVTQTRPGTLFGTYVGSWYGEYPALGHNYASPLAETSFWFHSPNYRKTGTAPLLDLVIPGCYYPTATIHEAMTRNVSIGNTVEAAGTLVNRLVRDQAWTYAGISLSDFKENPEGLQNVLQAACAANQGVMVFDLSHDIEPMWPVFKQAFGLPRRAPHTAKQTLARVRKRRETLDRLGERDKPIPISAGAGGTGQ